MRGGEGRGEGEEAHIDHHDAGRHEEHLAQVRKCEEEEEEGNKINVRGGPEREEADGHKLW